MTKLSIVIPSSGKQKENLFILLESISKQYVKAKNVYIIFNNCFLEDFQRNQIQLEKFENLNLIFSPKLGVNAARNEGLKLALKDGSEVILFLDDDCQLIDQYFLKKHIQFYESSPNFLAFGGAYLLSNKAKFFDKLYHSIQMKWFYSSKSKFLIGGNFSINMSVFNKFNKNFDENIIYGGSESEFFRYFKTQSVEVNNLGPSVQHNTCEGFISLTRKMYKQGLGQAYIDQKYYLGEKIDEIPFEAGAKENLNVLMKFFVIYFDLVFWLAYYSFQKCRYKFFLKIFKDMFGMFQKIRFGFLDRLKIKIEEEKKRGSRF